MSGYLTQRIAAYKVCLCLSSGSRSKSFSTTTAIMRPAQETTRHPQCSSYSPLSQYPSLTRLEGSRRQATKVTPLSPLTVPVSLGFHILIVLSYEPDAMWMPSGERATGIVSPVNVSHWYVFQTITSPTSIPHDLTGMSGICN